MISLSINVNVKNSVKLVKNAKKMLFKINEFLFEIDEILFKTKKLLFEIEKMLFETKKVEVLRKVDINDVEVLLFNLINVNIIMY